MKGIVDAALRCAGTAKVVTIRIEVGRLAGVAVEALRFGFAVCTRDTTLDGASLDIVEIAARMRCRACGHEADVDTWCSGCACGSFDRDVVSGQELRIKDLEVLDVS